MFDKKFLEGLKSLKDFGKEDATIRSIIGKNNYVIKRYIHKIEDSRMNTQRKNLWDNSKTIRELVKKINKKRKILNEGKKEN